MRLNFSPALQINNAFQSYQINRSAANKPGVNEAEGSNEERRDTFTLSPAGKTQNLINSLMKQKMASFREGTGRFHGIHQDAVRSLR